MNTYRIPVFYEVLAHSHDEARDALIATLETHEYDDPPDEPGHIETVCIGNLEEVQELV